MPIALLQAAVFNTAHRLDPWKGLVEAEVKPGSWSERRSPYDDDDEQLPSWKHFNPFNPEKRVYTITNNLFDQTPHLRKYFMLLDGIERTSCRKCGLIAINGEGRSKHVPCYHPINLALREMMKQEHCAICEAPFVLAESMVAFNDIPVCSEDCLAVWEYMNPDSFELVLEDVMKNYHAL